MSENNNQQQQQQPSLIGGHAQYVRGVTEVSQASLVLSTTYLSSCYLHVMLTGQPRLPSVT